jgi:hypothetical protein
MIVHGSVLGSFFLLTLAETHELPWWLAKTEKYPAVFPDLEIVGAET